MSVAQSETFVCQLYKTAATTGFNSLGGGQKKEFRSALLIYKINGDKLFNKSLSDALSVPLEGIDEGKECGSACYYNLIMDNSSGSIESQLVFLQIDAESNNEPPRAIPVSIIKSGLTFQIISCNAIISCGY